MFRRATSVCAVAATFLLAAPPCSAQETRDLRRALDSTVIPSRAVSHDLLRGIVYDVDTGEPIEGASISLGNRDNLTDASGHFSFEGNLTEGQLLRAQAVGYGAEQAPLPTRYVTHGLVARLALRKYEPPCTADVTGDYSVVVAVKDVLTGEPPPVVVALRARQDSTVAWNFYVAEEHSDATFVRALLEPKGVGSGEREAPPIELEVSAPGYALWHRSDIDLRPDECGFGYLQIPVFLVPTEPRLIDEFTMPRD